MKCYNCGRFGHRASDRKNATTSCFKCGLVGDLAFECKSRDIFCNNCGEAEHISTKCTKPKKEKVGGKVFALNVEEVQEPDNLIRGMCFNNSTPLIVIIDTGATHSFISLSCAERLNIVMTPMLRWMVIDTPTNSSVTTSLVCVKCLVNFGNVDFEFDLV